MPHPEIPAASVTIISRNMGTSLLECVYALFKQTFTDFEIIVVDDRSTDGTREILAGVADSRVRYFRNDRRLGYGGTRNLALKEARGRYVFFTDADCLPDTEWIQKGIAVYESQDCIGIVGKTLPMRDSTRRSERLVLNKDGRFMTCNMSMKREVLEELGGFDTAFDVGQEDVELGLRALKLGKIIFAQDMIVYHRVERYTVKRLFTDARRYKTQVMIFKRHPDSDYHLRHSPPRVRGIFLKPEDWWIIFCPIILFRSPSNQSLRDFFMIPSIYAATIYRRFIIWKTALKERVLLI